MRPVVGIFAHPDDEAFGPGGTIATLAKERDVYLICVTDGSVGMNSGEKVEDLGKARRSELLASAKTLGVKEVFFLSFKDGMLSNSNYHEVAAKIEELLKKLQPEIVLTYEPHGVSGHIDHIAVSFITSFVVKKLLGIAEIWQYCISNDSQELVEDYFIYFPKGYKKELIDKQVDISSVWETKVQAMFCHHSQTHDIEQVLQRQLKFPKVENFLVVKREFF